MALNFHTAKKIRSTIVHIGVLLLLLAGIVTAKYGYFGKIEIAEGSAVTLPFTSIKLKLEKFSIIPPVDSSSSEEYVSRLLIGKEGEKPFHYDLKVNNPLSIEGMRLYQMRYRVEVPAVRIAVYKGEHFLKSIMIKPSEREFFEEFGFYIRCDEILPDFVIDPEGNVGTRSRFFENPAVRLTLEEDGLEKEIWVFRSLHHTEKEEGVFRFLLQRIYKKYYSGINISKDPGLYFAYAGFIFLVAGSFMIWKGDHLC